MKTFRVLLAVLIAVGLFVTSAPAALADSEHCPAGGQKTDKGSGSVIIGGTTVSWSGHTVSVSGGTATFCVKAGNQSSGEVTITSASWNVTWFNGGDQTPNISYLVVYPTEQIPSATATGTPTATLPAKITPTATGSLPPGVTPTVTETPQSVPTDDGGEEGEGSGLPSSGAGTSSPTWGFVLTLTVIVLLGLTRSYFSLRQKVA